MPTSIQTQLIELQRKIARLEQINAAADTRRTPRQATFTSAEDGLVPASGGGTSTFLRADGSFATPAGGSGSGDFLADGSVPMTGPLDMGGAVIENVGNVDGVDVSAHAAATTAHGITSFAATVLDDTTASAMRTTLGLGTAALAASGDFEAAGAVAAHAAAGDPHPAYALESGLATVATSGSASDLGAGTLPLARLHADVVQTGDARLSDARTPTSHASAHVTGGADVIATFGTSAAGLVPASGGGTTNFLRADGTFAAPGGGGGAATQLDANGTTLDVDAMSNGQYLRRIGTTVVGATLAVVAESGDASDLSGLPGDPDVYLNGNGNFTTPGGLTQPQVMARSFGQ